MTYQKQRRKLLQQYEIVTRAQLRNIEIMNPRGLVTHWINVHAQWVPA